MEQNIIDRLIAKKKEFIDNNNKQSPTKLYLTLSDELDLSALPAEEIGDSLASLIQQHGGREGIKQVGNRFCGLEVVWDSDKFKIE